MTNTALTPAEAFELLNHTDLTWHQNITQELVDKLTAIAGDYEPPVVQPEFTRKSQSVQTMMQEEQLATRVTPENLADFGVDCLFPAPPTFPDSVDLTNAKTIVYDDGAKGLFVGSVEMVKWLIEHRAADYFKETQQ